MILYGLEKTAILKSAKKIVLTKVSVKTENVTAIQALLVHSANKNHALMNVTAMENATMGNVSVIQDSMDYIVMKQS